MASREHRFYTNTLGSISGTLYIGLTNILEKRVSQHKHHEFPGFTSKYGVDRLLYFERFDDLRSSINREKQLKGWTRSEEDRTH